MLSSATLTTCRVHGGHVDDQLGGRAPDSPVGLSGLSAMVTGGARGLGEVMARALLEAGASVLVVDTDLKGVEDFIATAGDRALGMRADVSNEDDVEAAFEFAARRLGGLDVLINNAGVNLRTLRKNDSLSPSSAFYQIGSGAFRRLFEIHLLGTFLCSRAAAVPMLERGFGRIITVTTSLDTMTRAGAVPYGPMKAGSEALTAAIAHDLEGTPVTANVLIPGGAAKTRMVGGEPASRDRLIDPAVMGPPAVWLASRESKGVTAMRFTANRWNPSLPPHEAARQAGAPIAWPSDRNPPATLRA